MKPDEKGCPQCAETVKRAAKVCRFCSYTFTERDDTIAAGRDAALKGEIQKPCTQCSILVPIGAETCRHCGYAFTKEELERTQMQQIWTYGGIALFCILLVAGVGFCSGSPDVPAQASRVRPGLEALLSSVTAAVEPCDRTSSAAADMVQAIGRGTGSAAVAANLARTARNTCRETAAEIGRMSPPPGLSPSDAEQAARTLRICKIAYETREQSWRTILRILAGDSRAGTLRTFQDEAFQAVNGIASCASGFEASAI